MKFKILLLLLSATCSLNSCSKGEKTYQTAINKTNYLLDSLMQARQIPGLSVAINVKGEMLLSKGFGYADLEQKVKVSPSETKFRIGSISKPLTADALVQLQNNGKLHLDSTIQYYLKNFPQKKGKITSRMVAGHLAGIRHYRGTEFLSSRHYNNVSDALDIFSTDTLISYPGKEFHYSSYGWNLLSAVIEKASNENFLHYMQGHVFAPLGMHNTIADLNDSIISNRSRFYSLTEDNQLINAPYVDNSCKWAGGGFISTSEDIVKFAQAHLREGYLNQTQIKELITPQKTSNDESTGYGLGWKSGKDKQGHFYYGHSGGSIGGASQMVIYPQEEVIVVILCNQGNAGYRGIQNRIANLFISNANTAENK